MAYERHYWECNEVVTAAQLNNIEDGVEEALECCGGGTEPPFLLINAEVEGNTTTLDHTWQEIYDVMSAGTPCFVLASTENGSHMEIVNHVYIDNGVYTVTIGGTNYTATTAGDYPSYTSSNVNPA